MNTSTSTQAAPAYLACEKRHTFFLLMLAAGWLGAFTYNLRGGVFCNAQTANFVLMAMALGKGQWAHGAYFLIPIGAYLAGAVLSECLKAAAGAVSISAVSLQSLAVGALCAALTGWFALRFTLRAAVSGRIRGFASYLAALSALLLIFRFIPF